MTNKLKLILPGLVVMIAGFSLAPAARADEWNKETIVTFSGPVQVPGKVLEAGTYVFKLDSGDPRLYCRYAGQTRDQLGGEAGRQSGGGKELVLSGGKLRFRVRLSQGGDASRCQFPTSGADDHDFGKYDFGKYDGNASPA